VLLPSQLFFSSTSCSQQQLTPLTLAIHQLTKKIGLEAPIAEIIHDILFQNKPATELITSFSKAINN